jgi:hypothetical protein
MPRCLPMIVCSAHATLFRGDAHPRAGAGEIVFETPASHPRGEARIDGCGGGPAARAAGQTRSLRSASMREVCSSYAFP